MKFRLPLALLVAGAMSISAVNPVLANEGGGVVDDLANAVATQPDVASTSAFVRAEAPQISSNTITAPSAGDEQFALELPGAATSKDIDLNDITMVTEGADFSTAVKDEGDGAFRALVHIPSVDAPQEYKFEVPEHMSITALEDGGAVVRNSDGDLAGSFAAPWAVDANGQSVSTSYSIEGNTLIQRVNFTANTAFPVVADPFWIPALFVVAHLTRHVITQAAARGISQALIRQVVQNGAKSAGKKGTSVFTQGKGTSKIRVIVDNKTGNIITVTKG